METSEQGEIYKSSRDQNNWDGRESRIKPRDLKKRGPIRKAENLVQLDCKMLGKRNKAVYSENVGFIFF